MSAPLSPTPRVSDSQHIEYMRLALGEAAKCIPSPTAFCVGCVITRAVGPRPPLELAKLLKLATLESQVLARGYSRELVGNTHAEANAIDKFVYSKNMTSSEPTDELAVAHLYTTLEPCSMRTSGLTPCVERILRSGIKKVYMGVEEPTDFVVCEGVRILREAGVEVFVVVDPGADLAKECLEAARRQA